jgi:hypothetical protein
LLIISGMQLRHRGWNFLLEVPLHWARAAC